MPEFPELPNGIFRDYVEFGSRVSYSKKEFHFASLLSIASMALGRRVVCQVGMTKIYCNLFAFVVGHTTISGKSASCNMAMEHLASIIKVEEEIATNNSVTIDRGTMSEPALVQGLNDTWNRFWYYDDCGGFFDDALSWNSKILGTLCSVYDGSEVTRTLSKRGKQGEQFKWECPEPYLSMLFNTTIKNLEEVSSAKLFNSGFFPRIMWFIGQGGQPRVNTDPSAEDLALLEDVKTKLARVKEFLYRIPPNSIVFGVSDTIETWKIKNDNMYLAPEDEVYRAACGRAFVHAYKIAAIFAMFDPEFLKNLGGQKYPINVKIPEKHSKAALDLVESYLLPRSLKVTGLSIACDMKNKQVLVMKALEHYGNVTTKTKLLQYTHLDRKEMDSALQALEDGDEIEISFDETSTASKKPMYIMKKV